MIEGMDSESRIISINNDSKLIKITQNYFCKNDKVQIIFAEGTTWIKEYKGEKFDLIFADA